ncbi:MAG TPA: ABC transporter ATP-binding protein [Nitrososphaerales archaeon]|nr:ABC transporter ATP-binding protein [Nitrososphaerales archaeon]
MASQAAWTGPSIEAKAVFKNYGSVTALAGLDFRVEPGEVYGLLGPNGAGKSTMIRIINGLTEPTSGTVRVMGYDPSVNPVEAKSSIGYVSETSMLYESLSPRDFFEFVASVRGIDRRVANERVASLSAAFGLGDFYDSPIATLSMGTKQKVSVIGSLLHEPKVLLLDEPLNGLDAKSSRILKDIISLHTERNNGAVLFSTHIMEIAQNLCTRIGIIYQGKLVAEGSLEDLRREASAHGEDSKATLEEVFLKLTHEEEEIAETLKTLRDAFFTSSGSGAETAK